MINHLIEINAAAKSMARNIVLAHVIIRQALCMITPSIEPVLWIRRAVIGAAMYGVVSLLTHSKLSNRRLAALVPISVALPEIYWAAAAGSGWLIYILIIGCSLLGMLFLEFRGLLFAMAVNCSALAFCIFVPGIAAFGMGIHTPLDAFFGFVGLILVNLLICAVCWQFTGASERFRETGEAFSTFMETTPGFLAVIDEHARVEHISRSLAEWFGISASRYAKKRAFLDLCGHREVMSAVQDVMERGGMVEEALVIRGDEGNQYFMLRSFPMAGSGAIARTFEFTDVTDMAEAKRAAEEASMQKSTFLANMSHEIRTPMNAIVGMTELMLTTPLTSEQLSHAQTVKSSAISLLTIIDDILDFSKLSAGKMEIHAAPFDIASLISDTLSITNIKAANAGLTLTATISKDVPPKINGDEGRIKQCLLNLMNNAVKFTKAGSVSLAISCEHIRDGLKLHFTVKDTGMGIKKSDIGKLFETFTRLDTKKNRNIAGTGLGLDITKHLVEMMGGRISVGSVYGEGSVFSFYIICEGAHTGKLADLPNPENYNVLVYEPDKNYTESLISMLLELNVRHDICYDLEDFEEMLGDGGYTHALYDRSAVKSVESAAGPHIKIAAMKEMHDNASGLNKPLLITSLVGFLGGIVEGGLDARRDEVKLGAFKTKNTRALLVDDNPINLTVAEGMLRQYGIDVATAVNGKEGMERMQSEEFDIAFFDHMMPVMDGIEAAVAIRALGGRFKAVPIIALTANAISGVEKMFIKAGMNALLAKPIIVKELHRILLEFLPQEKIVP